MTRREAPLGPLTPLSEHADGGGVIGNRRSANHSETMGLQSCGAVVWSENALRYASRVAT